MWFSFRLFFFFFLLVTSDCIFRRICFLSFYIFFGSRLIPTLFLFWVRGICRDVFRLVFVCCLILCWRLFLYCLLSYLFIVHWVRCILNSRNKLAKLYMQQYFASHLLYCAWILNSFIRNHIKSRGKARRLHSCQFKTRLHQSVTEKEDYNFVCD
jgi:hypothetical protein